MLISPHNLVSSAVLKSAENQAATVLQCPAVPRGATELGSKMGRKWFRPCSRPPCIEPRAPCDMASLAQIAGAPRIVGEFELSVTLRPNGNGGQLVSPIHDLVAYLRERELIHSAGPNDMRRLVLA